MIVDNENNIVIYNNCELTKQMLTVTENPVVIYELNLEDTSWSKYSSYSEDQDE